MPELIQKTNFTNEDWQNLNTLMSTAKRIYNMSRSRIMPDDIRLDSRQLDNWGLRLDANETMVLQQQLNQILTDIYATKFGENKARMLIPRTSRVLAGMRSYTWRERTRVGKAKMISNGADDLPQVSQYMTPDTAYIRPFGDAFSYDQFELREAATVGIPLSSDLAIGAREAYEEKVDEVLSTGLPRAGLNGFVNHPKVDVIQAPATGTGSSRLWADKTGPLIIADLEHMVTTMLTNTLEREIPDTIALPTARYRYIETTPYSTNNSDSIMTVFLRNSKYIKNIESWAKLTTADSAGTGPRAICYRYDSRALSYEEPIPFMMLPPQIRNLSYIVNCYGTYGGVDLYLPKSVLFMDLF